MAVGDRLSGICAFVGTVETGNFSAAAARLNLSRSAVAKSVARLELRIGARLFYRSTRNLSLTEEGDVFYQHCRRVLAELEQAEDALAAGQKELAGRVSITMPVLLGRRCIAPVLFAMAQRHPLLQLDLSFTDRRVDLIREGFDLAVRSGELPDSHAFQARALGSQRMVLCAARAYLEARGEPRRIEDLATHDGILYGQGLSGALWRFGRRGADAVSVEIPARCCLDDLEAILDAARAGLGIARLPVWLAGACLKSGELIPVLREAEAASYPLHLVWPASRQPARRIRCVIDELASGLPALLSGEF